MCLTNQERQQVRAALKFWNMLAINSRTHPSRHQGIAPYFRDEAPMSIEGIEALVLKLNPTPKKSMYVSIAQVCKITGWGRDWVYTRIRHHGIKPVTRGRYYQPDLLPLVKDHRRAAQADPR